MRLSAGKHRVVAGSANRFDEQFGRGNCRIELDAGAIGHQVNARRCDAGRRAQG